MNAITEIIWERRPPNAATRKDRALKAAKAEKLAQQPKQPKKPSTGLFLRPEKAQ